jgi:hypothetical protein
MTPLHHIGDFIREILLRVPLPAARGLFLATFLVVLLWVLTLPREETTDGAAGANLRNLKPWAALALLVQIVIYALL